MEMGEAYKLVNTLAPSSLPIYRADVEKMMEGARAGHRQQESAVQQGCYSAPSRHQIGIGSTWLRRCYGSVMTILGSRTGPRERDIEAAVTSDTDPTRDTTFEPKDTVRRNSLPGQSKDGGGPETEDHPGPGEHDYHSPAHHGLAALTVKSDSSPRLLSDEENERMNRKIDKLIAAIDDRRPIHFEPKAETCEVEIFADHEVIDQDEADELERNIAASPENFGRIIKDGNGLRRMRSPHSLHSAASTDSWASTDSENASSNAWEREIAAANVRFALANGGVDGVETPVRHPFRSPSMVGARRGRPIVREISPIPLDFHKPLRPSTPSVHSNGSEQDTSSPLFARSCERILRDTYAQAPESTFQRDYPENSQLDEFASTFEPRDAPPPEAHEVNMPSSTGRAFGVFQEELDPESRSKDTGKSALRSKVLKDISNLRRPGYLQFNSFAKDAGNRGGTAASTTASSANFEGASNPESRRAYISKRWPGLLRDRGSGSMVEVPRLDGVARRRNEQAIGHPVDTSLYSLTHVRTSVADSSPAIDPTRQAHFDLALARLEGRALPPPPTPIHRHPDWAALSDRDIQIEGDDRPLPLEGPVPSRHADSILRWGWWRNSR